MNLAKAFLGSAVLMTLLTVPAHATTVVAEHVTGGVLDLTWVPGFAVLNTMEAVTLTPADPGYANPSGDHTVGRIVNAVPDSGGIVLPATDPQGQSDYTWEADVFTGDGNSRRGLVVRADPSNGFGSCYQFVMQAGLLQFNFRKLVNSTPSTLGTWFSNTFPGGIPATNTWHHMKVVASVNTFRCFWDGVELTPTPIVDPTPLLTGWVGAYNFRFDQGGIPFLLDDLTLSVDDIVPALPTSWGSLKARYAR